VTRVVDDLAPCDFLSAVDAVEIESLTDVAVERIEALGRNPHRISDIGTADGCFRAFAVKSS